jgi:hypothetical protein
MKILNIAFFALLISVVGCTKKEDLSIAKSDSVSLTKLQSELIIGSWQLASIGTITKVASSSSGCGGSGSGERADISWTSTSQSENMSFKSTGDFSKNSANDAVCSGTYKVDSGAILTKSSCSVEEQKRTIHSINASTLVVEDNNTMYSYEKK